MNILKNISRVAVGMSGGVDSAVAALILKKRRYETIGVFMKNWDLVDETGQCSQEKDLEDAEEVCRQLGIQFRVVNFIKQYWTEVFTDLISDYEQGLTPNPDIMCNKHIKFKHFYNYSINDLGCDAIATGHYAQNSYGEQLEQVGPFGAELLKAVDSVKDQTFFLSQIPQLSLQKTMFPLGQLLKSKVKKIALENNLNKIALKKESTGICFIGSRDFQSFILEYVKPQEGNFIDIDTGKIVGKHLGKHTCTLGQRCNIGGQKDAYYVARKSSAQEIYVAMGHDHPSQYSKLLTTEPFYWINTMPKELERVNAFDCEFRFQHGQSLVHCSVILMDDGKLFISLNEPLRALTPGQFAVLYKNQKCLGSGRIACVGPSDYIMNFKDSIARLKNLSNV